MQLLFWRHAEAEDGVPDLERKLTAHGHHQAKVVADWLKPRLPQSYRALISPATRARQTVAALSPERAIIEPRLYPGTSVTAVLQAIGIGPSGDAASHRTGDGQDVLLVVGHQPWIGETIALLMTGQPDYWSIRKAALWWLVQRGPERWNLLTVMDADLA